VKVLIDRKTPGRYFMVYCVQLMFEVLIPHSRTTIERMKERREESRRLLTG